MGHADPAMMSSQDNKNEERAQAEYWSQEFDERRPDSQNSYAIRSMGFALDDWAEQHARKEADERGEARQIRPEKHPKQRVTDLTDDRELDREERRQSHENEVVLRAQSEMGQVQLRRKHMLALTTKRQLIHDSVLTVLCVTCLPR